MIIWFTGLSGAGKTTLSNSLYKYLKDEGMKNIVWLDGDVLRDTVSPDLDFTKESRIIQISKTQKLAKHLESQDHLVIVSALYSNKELLSWNKNNFKDYFEIYVHADIENLSQRDSKKLYSGAQSGKIKNVVGVDIDWEIPKNPNLVIDNNIFVDIDIITEDIINRIHKI